MTALALHEWTRCVRLVSLACVVVIVLATSSAGATAVPLCDELAQSIAAPPPLMPSRDGEIVPCAEERVWFFDLSSTPAQSPQSVIVSKAPDSGLPSFDNLPPLNLSERLGAPPTERDAGRPAFDNGVYRPPRMG